MKKFASLVLCILLLCGCKSSGQEMDRIMSFRQTILQAESISFYCDIIADYGEYIHNFSLDCTFDSAGNMKFKVMKPDSISGITGTVASDGGKLTFDDMILGFPLLADGYISPVSAPWLFMKTLRSGYLDGCGRTDDGWLISAYDSYESDTMEVQIYTNPEFIPSSAEFLWGGRRILSLCVSNFSYL